MCGVLSLGVCGGVVGVGGVVGGWGGGVWGVWGVLVGGVENNNNISNNNNVGILFGIIWGFPFKSQEIRLALGVRLYE